MGAQQNLSEKVVPIIGTEAVSKPTQRCRLCTCILDEANGDNLSTEVCRDCRTRPEARRLGSKPMVVADQKLASARDFTAVEKTLIQKMHGYVPAKQLLDLLNERLACDLGPSARKYTMAQLHVEISACEAPAPSGGHDWATLRKVIAKARREGVLEAINTQVIDDFAVVYSLSPGQVLRLKDVILPAIEVDA